MHGHHITFCENEINCCENAYAKPSTFNKGIKVELYFVSYFQFNFLISNNSGNSQNIIILDRNLKCTVKQHSFLKIINSFLFPFVDIF